MKKTLLSSVAALSLLVSGWVAANTPYAKQKVVYPIGRLSPMEKVLTGSDQCAGDQKHAYSY